MKQFARYKKTTASYAFFLLASFPSFAQESFNAGGTDVLGGTTTGSVSFTVGQIDYTYQTSKKGNLEAGVQHAYEIYTLEVDELAVGAYSLLVFPNPAMDELTIQIENYAEEKWHFQLLDLHGKLIQTGGISQSQTAIDMRALVPSSYLIQVLSDKNEKIKTFQVIKNNY